MQAKKVGEISSFPTFALTIQLKNQDLRNCCVSPENVILVYFN